MYKNMSKNDDKIVKIEHKKERYKLNKKINEFFKSDNFVFAQYKKSLKFGEIKLKLKEFQRSKQPIYLNQAETNKIVISNEFKLVEK